MPPSGSGGQHMPGAGEHGMGDGAPQGGLCGPQQGVSLQGPQHPHPLHILGSFNAACREIRRYLKRITAHSLFWLN